MIDMVVTEPELSLDEVFDSTAKKDSDNSLGGSWGFASVERRLDLNLSLDLGTQEGRMQRVLERLNIAAEVKNSKDGSTTRNDKHLRKLPQKRAEFQKTVDLLQDDLALALQDVEALSGQFEKWRSQAQQRQKQQGRLFRYSIQKGVAAAVEDDDDSSVASEEIEEEEEEVVVPKKSKKKKKSKEIMGEESEISISSSSTKTSKKKKKKKKNKKAMKDDSGGSFASSIASEESSNGRPKDDDDDEGSYEEGMDSFVTAAESADEWEAVSKKSKQRKSSIVGDYELSVEDLGLAENNVQKKKYSVTLKKLGESCSFSSLASDVSDVSDKKKEKKKKKSKGNKMDSSGRSSTSKKKKPKQKQSGVDDTESAELIAEGSAEKIVLIDVNKFAYFDWSHFHLTPEPTVMVQNRPDFFNWDYFLQEGTQPELTTAPKTDKRQNLSEDGKARKLKKRHTFAL